MKINGNNPIENQEVLNKVKDINKNKNADTKENANKSDDKKDRITLSGKAKEINELKNIIDQFPEVRADRVEALKKAIETGNYDIDSMKIARKMLEES